jgi:hypothetical protein
LHTALHSQAGLSIMLNRFRYWLRAKWPVCRRAIHVMCFQLAIPGCLVMFRSWAEFSRPPFEVYCHFDFIVFKTLVLRADFNTVLVGVLLLSEDAAACLAALSAISFPSTPLWPGIQNSWTSQYGFLSCSAGSIISIEHICMQVLELPAS